MADESGTYEAYYVRLLAYSSSEIETRDIHERQEWGDPLRLLVIRHSMSLRHGSGQLTSRYQSSERRWSAYYYRPAGPVHSSCKPSATLAIAERITKDSSALHTTHLLQRVVVTPPDAKGSMCLKCPITHAVLPIPPDRARTVA